MRKREFGDQISFIRIFIVFIAGLVPSICLAEEYTIFDKIDPRSYVITSKYFRFSPPKKIITSIKAVDPRYPNCEYRKVTFYPVEYYYQFYGRLSANFNEVNVDGQSSSEATGTVSGFGLTVPFAFRSGALKTSNASTLEHGGEIALGYLWCHLRAEAEFLINSKNSGTATATLDPSSLVLPVSIPNFPTNPILVPMNVELQTQCYFANLYYDFFISERIRPFIMCGAGMAVNTLSINSNDIVSIQSTPTRRYNFAYSGGLGVRIRVFSSLFATASYRYIRLGTVSTNFPSMSANFNNLIFARVSGTQMSTAELYQNSISLGLMYLF